VQIGDLVKTKDGKYLKVIHVYEDGTLALNHAVEVSPEVLYLNPEEVTHVDKSEVVEAIITYNKRKYKERIERSIKQIEYLQN